MHEKFLQKVHEYEKFATRYINNQDWEDVRTYLDALRVSAELAETLSKTLGELCRSIYNDTHSEACKSGYAEWAKSL